jgi:8-oxo-dGTP pyrophosphatase MutT (NUDIX family)
VTHPIDFAALVARLAERPRLEVRLDGFRESAVLVPILVEPDLPPRLIFIVREAAMRTHAGQIAFPGGQRDEGDVDLRATAIRETSEELGIAPAAIEVLGLLDDVPTPSSYVITPVVARVDGPVRLSPAPGEVAEVMLVELTALADPANYRCAGVREFLGVSYDMHEYRVAARVVWGATARMVCQLLDALR